MAQYVLMCEWKSNGVTYPEGSIVELDDERGERFCELQLAIRADQTHNRIGSRHSVRPRGAL